MGAIGKRRESITRLLGLVAGSLVPVIAGNIKMDGKPIDGKIVGAASVVIGYLLPSFVKGDLVAGIGDGMLASGGVQLLNEFNVLSGIPVIAGWQDLKVINGVDKFKEAEKLRDGGQDAEFRPSMAQRLNGYYSRGYDD